MKWKVLLALWILAFLIAGFNFTGRVLAQSEEYRLVYGTYFGWKDSYDTIVSLDVQEGSVYITGDHAREVNNLDVYYAKFTKSGRDVEYIHFFGGSGNDEVTKIRVDKEGNIYIFGKTSSNDLPMRNAFQNQLIGSTDLFIAKFSPKGNIIFSTYFGGEYPEQPVDMEIDAMGNVYITGYTEHSWGENENLKHIPLKNARFGFNDMKKIAFFRRSFIAKLDTNGNLLFSTYWPLYEMQIAPADKSFYVGGFTTDPNYYVTAGAFDTICGVKDQKCSPNAGNSDIAITKLNGNLNVLYSTFIGSTGADYLKDLYVDEKGYVYGVGVQAWKNSDFPLKNPAMTKPEGDGASYGIVFKMTPALSTLVYSTYFMREGSVNSIRVEDEEAYITGVTKDVNGSNLTTSDALMQKAAAPVQNIFFAKLGPTGQILYCTLVGGHGDGWASEVAVEKGEAYIGGYTQAYDVPVTEDSFKEKPNKELGALAEGYLVKFGFKKYPPKLPEIMLNRTVSIGENMWEEDIKEVKDGYVILAASDDNPSHPILVRTDENGNLLWYKKYSEINGVFPSLTTESDGYLIFGTMNGKATLIKTDLKGNVIWSKNYAEYGSFQRGREVVKVQEGYVLLGSTNGTWGGSRGLYRELFLINVDKNGNPLWESYINVEKLGMSPDIMPRQVKETKEGYIIVGDTAGTEKLGTSRIFVIKTNTKGKYEWVRYLGRNSNGKVDYAKGFTADVSDDGYIVLSGYVYNTFFGGSDLYIAKLDLTGNLIWEKVTGKVEDDEPVRVLKADTGFVLFDRAGKDEKAYFFKFNDNGIKEYSFGIDMSKQDLAVDMERVSDGYLLLLSSNSFSNTRDLWLIKVEGPKIKPHATGTLTNTSTQTQTSTSISETENITKTSKEMTTSTTEKAKETAKGICGPGTIVALSILLLVLRRR